MSTKTDPPASEFQASVDPDAARTDHQPAGKGSNLVADLSGIFTNRRHGRGAWYLPALRGDGRD